MVFGYARPVIHPSSIRGFPVIGRRWAGLTSGGMGVCRQIRESWAAVGERQGEDGVGDDGGFGPDLGGVEWLWFGDGGAGRDVDVGASGCRQLQRGRIMSGSPLTGRCS